MHSRLKELAREAGLLVHNPEGVPTKLEKFAELIVRECIKAYNDDGYQTEYEQDLRVLQHFGVVE